MPHAWYLRWDGGRNSSHQRRKTLQHGVTLKLWHSSGYLISVYSDFLPTLGVPVVLYSMFLLWFWSSPISRISRIILILLHLLSLCLHKMCRPSDATHEEKIRVLVSDIYVKLLPKTDFCFGSALASLKTVIETNHGRKLDSVQLLCWECCSVFHLYRHSWSPDDESKWYGWSPGISSSATFRLKLP